MIQCIAEHSVDISLLTRSSNVLDLGCRYFGFSKAMLEYVDKVCAVDADSMIVNPLPQVIKFLNAAVGTGASIQPFIKFGNGTGNFLHSSEPLPSKCEIEHVNVFSLEEVCEFFGVPFFDLIKMDVEGSEYELLHDLDCPIATSLSFELHQHTAKRKPQWYINELFDNLKQWYDFPVIDYSEKHGAGFNYWDCLGILKTNL